MDDLWSGKRREMVGRVAPLAVRMRPRSLEEVAGQRHILGPGKLLRRMIDADALTSVVFHGPPGTGKTTLAEVIARYLNRHFERENAASVGVARIREIIQGAERRLTEAGGKRTVLFLDEIHRFSRSQQDVLLADVERGLITLVGATTENPLFAVNSALVSRSTLFRLEPLSEDEIVEVLRRAVADEERGYGKLDLRVEDGALRVWAVKCDGDARRALTALEVAVLSGGGIKGPRDHGIESGEEGIKGSGDRGIESGGGGPGAGPDLIPGSHDPSVPPPLVITRADAEESIQQKAAVYDATGDEHYDTISAFIKSVRGSDPDAAIYWLARMLDAGEDVRFIARRLAILASEDIGNADPRGIMVAAACWELVERIGMPEARITLAQCVTYLAMSPKSNASYNAINEAMADVKEGRTLPVPVAIKDKNVRKASEKSEGVGKGEGYEYAHDLPTIAGIGGVSHQDYLGVDKQYYRPTDHGTEKQFAERLEEIRRWREGMRGSGGDEEVGR